MIDVSHAQPKLIKLESVVVDILFNVLPIVCGSSVFVFVLLCTTLCSF